SNPATPEVSGAYPLRWRANLYLATLVLGYIGIYLCRKNFSVAIPLIREELGVTKEAIGRLASLSTLAYVVGKVAFGPLIDRLGGRGCFLISLGLVAVFGGAGAFVPSLGGLTVAYSLNRLAGAGGWGAMVKLVPDWFEERSRAFAFAVLSLSFVFGGVIATLLAGWIVGASGGSWRWVMGGPSLVLIAVGVLCAFVLPRERDAGIESGTGSAPVATASQAAEDKGRFRWAQVRELFRTRQFWVVCALSFTLTLLRETFNTWTVDFFKTEGGNEVSHRIAAFLSTPFDACGAAGILLLGWAFGRVTPSGRRRLLFGILAVLGLLLFALPSLARQGLWVATFAVGLVGFLTYGPYSLLAGVLSLEIRGRSYVATVAGLVDATGYLAAVLAGAQFGRLLDVGGYAMAFPCLAFLAVLSAVLCLFLYPAGKVRSEAPAG
ncbi:MAG: MFS transporter, partial [Verrucomicrobiales bacterium]|nr:MFS transporter [Verrucomicrobiales bacterium]